MLLAYLVIPPVDARAAADWVWSGALLASLVCAVICARTRRLNVRVMYWASTSALLAGLWGGHLLSLLVHGWDGGPWAAFDILGPGKSLFGGLCAGAIAAALCFRFRKASILAYSDAAMPAVALGYAIGRIGCFVNGDDFGTVTGLPWAVTYRPGTEAYADHLSRAWIQTGAASSLPIHPVQLYHSLVGVALLLLMVNWRPQRPGARLSAYVALYGVARFFLEWVRGDFRAVAGPFSLPQVFSMLFVAASAIWFAGHRWTLERARSVAEPLWDGPVSS